MSVAVVPLSAERLPALRALVEDSYARPRADAYFRWAYLGDPSHRAWVAMDGDHCLAVLRAFERSYLLEGRRATVLETFDWYADPESRPQAAGLRVMRAAMEEGVLLVNVGGTQDTLAILPRLRWRVIDTASSFLLPLGPAAFAAAAPEGRRLEPLARVALAGAVPAWFGRGRAPAPTGGEAVELPLAGDEVLELYEGPTGYDVVPIPDPGHLRWLTGGLARSSAFVTLAFRVGGRIRGWGMARVYPGHHGSEASLLEVFAPRPDVDLYAWMVSSLVARVRLHRPVLVRAQATCPVLASALRRLRFLRGAPQPVHVWAGDRAVPGGRTHFALSTQDFPILPYPDDAAFAGDAPRAGPGPEPSAGR